MVDTKKKQEKKIRVSFCPNCKSNNVKYVFGFGNLFGVMPKMQCLDCGFSAPSFPILITNKREIEAVKKKLKAKNAKKRIAKKGGKK